MALYALDPHKEPGTISRREMLAFGMSGAVGQSNSAGFSTCGSAKCGDDSPISGIYSSRPYGYNQFGKTDRITPGRILNRSYYVKRTYRPTNPQTPSQQAWRAVFAAGIAAYQGLTPEQKAVYHKRAVKRGTIAFRVFMREYLNEHKL